MNQLLHPFSPRGNVRIPPSKSAAHRAILCAGLAEGKSRIRNIAYSQDIRATIAGIRTLGAEATEFSDSLEITGAPLFSRPYGKLEFDCGESGSTLRFLLPLAALAGAECRFTGRGRLLERPQSVYESLFSGGEFFHTPQEIRLKGGLSAGEWSLRGDVSSQFITGLLFSLPLLDRPSRIRIQPPFESRSYVTLTLRILADFGVQAAFSDPLTLEIPGGQRFRPSDYTVEGDDSQMAFFGALGSIRGGVSCTGLRPDSVQGDRVILSILREFGAKITEEAGMVFFEPGRLQGKDIDLADCPDLGPILMVLGAFAEGETRILHAGRLRLKESDRIAAMESELRKLGVDISSDLDTVWIRGRQPLTAPAEVCAQNDHRIAMSLAVFAACAEQPVNIIGSECVAKSYPAFWEDFTSLMPEKGGL